METKAAFGKILNLIEGHILDSKNYISISVAWFTNKELLGLLTDKVKQGVKVQVIVSDDIINRRLNPKEFINNGGEYLIVSSEEGKFLHEKFAVFDGKYVISGSYNWTYFAEYRNYESVIISSSKDVIKQFEIRFKNLRKEVISFERDLVNNTINIGADKNEAAFEKLESNLEKEFLYALDESKKLNVKINFDFVLTYIQKYGAIGASKRLMMTGTEKVQSGFIKMWEIGRIDLTFESIITKKEYAFLFDERTLKNANERLKEFTS